MSIGGKGVISVASNLLPARDQAADEARRWPATSPRRRTIHHQLFPLIKTLFLDGNPAGIKHAMKLAGRDSGELRLPLWEASEATKKAIEEQVRKLGVLYAAA